MRFIHTKSDTAKLFGQIVISEAKSNIFKYMSKYQIATKPGHRASEHLYAVMSVLGTIQKKKKAIIVSMWDLKAFFDSENLIDCMSELYKKKIKGKLYRLIFRMNQNIRISVKTAVGETEEKDTGNGVGQGTVEGAVISSSSIDGGVTEEFSEYNSSDESEPDDNHPDKNSNNENNPDEIASDFFHPMIFQDDVLKVSDGIESANDANKKMMNVIESKLLTLNYEKTNYVVFGDKKARKRLLEDLKKDPLLINGQIMKQSPCSKYLDHICQ